MANSTRVEHFTAPDIILKYWANLKNTLAYLMATKKESFVRLASGNNFKKLFFLHHSRMNQISLSVCPK